MQRRLATFLVGLVANALICGGVSMIDPRFQSRVIWLVPMFALWLLSESGVIQRLTASNEEVHGGHAE